MATKKIAVVGGGMTGLTAAYYLKQKIKEQQLPYEVTLIEAGHRVGGKIQTVRKNGFIMERGPDSFLERKTPAVKLVTQLGLTDQLVRNSTGQAHVLVRDTLYEIPSGTFMGIPVWESALTETHFISETGKERIQEELSLQKSKPMIDQSLGHFLRQRLGDELIENLIEPLLSGIYSSDIDKMSLMATFPQFFKLEQEYGSLIKGLRKTLPQDQASTGKKKGQFLSFKNGLETIVEALFQKLGNDTCILGKPVKHIIHQDGAYHLELEKNEVREADAILMTVPHHHLPSIFKTDSLFAPFMDIPVTSVANVVLAFDQSAIQYDQDGTGFVVSRNSDFRITACTWTDKKWPTTTPNGKVLLRAYVGKPSDQKIVHLADDEIVKIVLKDLAKVMNLAASPEFTMVTRWKQAMPQYTVGHVETVKMVRNEMKAQLPGVFIAGSSFEGVGIPDCIHQGEQAADDVLQFLASSYRK